MQRIRGSFPTSIACFARAPSPEPKSSLWRDRLSASSSRARPSFRRQRCSGFFAKVCARSWKIAGSRADFFWDEAHRILQRLQRAEGGIVRAFELLLARMPAGNGATAESVAARVIDEIFIDTHVGFYNGRVKSAAELPRDDRAFAHLERIKALLPYSGMNERERAAFLRPARRAQFEAFKQSKAWNDAAKIARELLEAEPNDLGAQEHFIEAVVQGALASLSNDNSDSANRRGAKSLQKAIRELEAMRPKMLLNEDLYGALRHLHHMCAIRLANRGQFSQALVSVPNGHGPRAGSGGSAQRGPLAQDRPRSADRSLGRSRGVAVLRTHGGLRSPADGPCGRFGGVESNSRGPPQSRGCGR